MLLHLTVNDNSFTPNSAESKIQEKKNLNLVCTMWKNKQYHWKVMLRSFQLNSHRLSDLEPHYTTRIWGIFWSATMLWGGCCLLSFEYFILCQLLIATSERNCQSLIPGVKAIRELFSQDAWHLDSLQIILSSILVILSITSLRGIWWD